MTEAWSVHRLISVRMANQGLTARTDRDPRAVALRTVGIQAQDVPATHLAMRSRCADLDLDGSVAATEVPPSVVRTWLMRGTLHAVATEDVRWLTALMGPALLKRFRTHRAEHSLTDSMLAKAQAALPAILSGRELTRAELVRELADAAIAVRTPGQAPAHFTIWASSVGLICRGAERGRELTYALLDDWVPPAPVLGESAAYVALVRRYVGAFGPATIEDFATWSGLPISRARTAFAEIADELDRITVDGREHFHNALEEPEPGTLRLLAGWDTYLMGYRDRAHFLPAGSKDKVMVGGWIYPSVVLDGQIVGSWRVARRGERVAVRIAFLTEPTSAMMAKARAEADDIGRFYGHPATFELVSGF